MRYDGLRHNDANASISHDLVLAMEKKANTLFVATPSVLCMF